MKKLLKKLITVVISAAMAVSAIAIPVGAEENNSDNTTEYFSFANPDSRIDSNGDFTFEIRWSVDSDEFTFTSTKSTLTVSAHIEDLYTHDKYYEQHLCRIYIENGLSRKSYDFYADGEEYTFDLVDLKVDKNSKITISNVDSLPATRRVFGAGNLTNISLK